MEGIPISSDGVVSLQWLAEGKDGIYRPTAGVYQEKARTDFLAACHLQLIAVPCFGLCSRPGIGLDFQLVATGSHELS